MFRLSMPGKEVILIDVKYMFCHHVHRVVLQIEASTLHTEAGLN